MKKRLVTEISSGDVFATLLSKGTKKKILAKLREVDKIVGFKYFGQEYENAILDAVKGDMKAVTEEFGLSEEEVREVIEDRTRDVAMKISGIMMRSLPIDLTDNQKGTAANFLKKMLLSRKKHILYIWLDTSPKFNKSGRGSPANKVYQLEQLFKHSYKNSIEDFFKMQDFIDTERFSKDLMGFKTAHDLINATDDARPRYKADLEKKAYLDAKEGMEKIYEDDNWQVTAVHNKGAACELGKGTSWCTAAPGLDYFEHYYSPESPLFVFIDKKENKKYQFWYGKPDNAGRSQPQLMDKDDRPIRPRDAFPLHYILLMKNVDKKYPVILEQGSDYGMPTFDQYEYDSETGILTVTLKGELSFVKLKPRVLKYKDFRFIEREQLDGDKLNESVRQPVDFESFQVKDELNQEIWLNKTLSPQISQRLKKIANNFLESLDIPRRVVKDITFTGSLANYNWSRYSDIDLHIVLDFADIDENEELVKKFFDSRRLEWNKTHNIKIKDHEVEIYVQQSKEPHHSSGVYSVLDNQWLTEPTKQAPHMDEADIQKKTDYFMQEIDEVNCCYRKGKYKEALRYAEKLKERIKCFRKCGLEKGGEYSTENIAFKALRRAGYLDLLSQLKNSAYDKLMTLDEGSGGYTTSARSGGWLPDDPTGWTTLKDGIFRDYPGSEVAAVYDDSKKILSLSALRGCDEIPDSKSEIMDKIADWADSVQACIAVTPIKRLDDPTIDSLFQNFYKNFGFHQNRGRWKNYSLGCPMYRKPQR